MLSTSVMSSHSVISHTDQPIVAGKNIGCSDPFPISETRRVELRDTHDVLHPGEGRLASDMNQAHRTSLRR
jgi:hypothetical protein